MGLMKKWKMHGPSRWAEHRDVGLASEHGILELPSLDPEIQWHQPEQKIKRRYVVSWLPSMNGWSDDAASTLHIIHAQHCINTV